MSYLFINLSASRPFVIQLKSSAESTNPFSGRVIYSRTQLVPFKEDFDMQLNVSCIKGHLITSTKLHYRKKNRERNTDCVQSKYLKWAPSNCLKHVGYCASHHMAWMVE